MIHGNIAIVGVGHIFPHYVRALEANPNFKLVGVCDLDPQKSTKNIPFFTDLDELVEKTQPEIVAVCTPNTTHYSVAKSLLEKGVIYVTVEKPATQSLAEFDDLCRIADVKGTLLVPFYHYQFADEVVWFKNYYFENKDELGPLTGFSAGFYDSCRTDGILEEVTRSLQCPWLDSGINALSVALQFAPRAVHPRLRWKVVKANMVDNLQGSSEFSFGYNHEFHGIIDTHWTELSTKSTRLDYADSRTSIHLMHSDRKIVKKAAGKEPEVLADFTSDRPRLTEHYDNLFKRLASLGGTTHSFDYFLERECLSLLFEAYHFNSAK